MRRPTVAIIGNGALREDDPRGPLAFEVGRALVDHGFRLVCGGLGGVMAAACAGAAASERHVDGDIVGLLPGFDPDHANQSVDIAIATGLDHARNFIVANADAVVAIGGQAGTLSEMAGAWTLQRLLIGLRVEGWSGRLADHPLDERVRYPDIPDDRVWGADNATQVIDLLQRWLPRYRRRHGGIPPRRDP